MDTHLKHSSVTDSIPLCRLENQNDREERGRTSEECRDDETNFLLEGIFPHVYFPFLAMAFLAAAAICVAPIS